MIESILAALAAQILPAVGLALVGLVTWGISLLKAKINSDLGKNALDQLNQIIAAVVGQLTQTVVEQTKASAPNGKLTDKEKRDLKNIAILQINALLTEGVTKAASVAVGDLQGYISKKIEEQVLAQKK